MSAAPDEWVSKEMADAFNADAAGEPLDRSESLQFWAQVAAGEFTDDTKDWLRLIAKRVVAADQANLKVRNGEIVRAVGLSGKLDRYAEMREYIDTITSFEYDRGPFTRKQLADALYARFPDQVEEIGRAPGDGDLRSWLDREIRKARNL
jgi:hypothetical protein